MNHLKPIVKILIVMGFLLITGNTLKAQDIIVAKDGSGNYMKVQDAFNAVTDNSLTITTIFVKNGTYKEKLVLSSSKINVRLIGESRDNTILTYDDQASNSGTSGCYSTLIEADDVYAENLTFQNTIDSRDGGSQAVALMVTGDKVILYNCRITGFQDTYYLQSNTRTYHKNCIIEGTTDFIFGAGIALFEDCVIRNRKDSHITAHSQKLIDGKPVNKYGFVFKNCEIVVHPQESVSNASLGRPWGNAARVVYLNCYEGGHIRPEGWSVWNDNVNHLTAYYAEYNCTGPGYQPASRLSWTHQLTDSEAAIYTKEQIFKANTTTAVNLSGDWNPKIDGASSPSVNITSPSDNAIFNESDNITITANATDSDGSVTSVEFFQGATSLGSDYSSPFSVTWSNLAIGSYKLTAKATDNDGVTTISSAVNISVNIEGAETIIIQEKETGFVSCDGVIDNNNSGFTGEGFSNTYNATGKGINWEICIPENGTYTLVWRFANGSSDNRIARVVVDGSVEVSNVSFSSTGSWSTWDNSSAVNVTLSAGTHQIRLEATNSTGLANIDYISIAGSSPRAGKCSTTYIPVTGVSVSPSSLSLDIIPICNEYISETLTATVIPDNATNKNVIWTTSDPSIVTVNNSGVVTIESDGTAIITVATEDGNKTAICEVNIGLIIPLISVAVLPTNVTILFGSTTQLTASVLPDCFSQNVSWSSSNSSVASVSSLGLVTGMAEGSASITVTTQDGGFTATCNVSVSDIPTPKYGLTTSVVGQGSVSPSSGTFDENEQVTLTATPASNWKFVSWSGDAISSSTHITITMNSDKSVIANFEAIENGGCDNPVTISLPYSQNGEGEYCWQTSGDISYINSWNLEMLEINGVDFTNIWAGNMPPKQDGYYIIHYVGNYGWSHFEAATLKSAEPLENEFLNEISVYPNPFDETVFIDLSGMKNINRLDILNFMGQIILAKSSDELSSDVMSFQLDNPGILFIIQVYANDQVFTKSILKK